MTNVFIDGSAGTTGLRIHERLATRTDLNIITLSDDVRKDINARRDAINSSDIAFLCLPDAAAIEAVSLVCSDKVSVIDTSTAHRTNSEWAYGFAELSGYREKIADSKRVANPGCHATGFIALVEPLVKSGIISEEQLLSCFSITGYSGGGKKMISEYQCDNVDVLYSAPRQYGLSQEHKHLKEMMKISGLNEAPVFCPIVSNYYSGMEVTVSLFKKQIKGTVENIKEIYSSYYTSPLVHFNDAVDESGFMSAASMSGRDDIEITVLGNDDRILLVSRFDNLGKGASGAAIQNMNIILGKDETLGLNLK